MPITAFIGVRISWLMVARKALLASLAASAAARAACASLNRRTFSIAITAWSAKVCSASSTLAGMGPGVSQPTLIVADRLAVAQQGYAQESPARARSENRLVLGVQVQIFDADRTTLENRPASAEAARRQQPLGREGSSQRRDVSLADEGRDFQPPALVAIDERAGGLAEIQRQGDDLVEHRLHVGRRVADGIQHLGRRGLLLERISGFVEETGVLQRHAGLERQADQELELVRLERLAAVAPHRHRPLHRLAGEQGHDHQALVAAAVGAGNLHAARVGAGVVDQLRPAALEQAADDADARLARWSRGSPRPPRRTATMARWVLPRHRAGRSRCGSPAAAPSHGRRSGPSPSPGRARRTGRGRRP